MKHEGNGLYYGLNLDKHQKIICDRRKLKNPNGFVFGTSGNSGKLDAVREKDEQTADNTEHKQQL